MEALIGLSMFLYVTGFLLLAILPFILIAILVKRFEREFIPYLLIGILLSPFFSILVLLAKGKLVTEEDKKVEKLKRKVELLKMTEYLKERGLATNDEIESLKERVARAKGEAPKKISREEYIESLKKQRKDYKYEYQYKAYLRGLYHSGKLKAKEFESLVNKEVD